MPTVSGSSMYPKVFFGGFCFLLDRTTEVLSNTSISVFPRDELQDNASPIRTE